MMTTYNLTPVPVWVLRDNLGFPLANGYMKAFRDTVRSEYKAVYQDAAGTLAWLQPIVFNAAGFQGPFYWASDENYYLEIYDSNNNLVKSISGYNAPQSGGSAPIVNNIDIKNYITDADFSYCPESSITPVPVLQQISTSNWFFEKGNTSATDEIQIIPFSVGSSVPPNNPNNYFHYECSIAGSAEGTKYLEFRFDNVSSWQNREFTFAFWGQSSTIANQVEIYAVQNFGTGGSPSATVFTPVVAFNLAPTWTQYSATFTAPSIVGKVLGTNNDNYFGFFILLPVNSATIIDLTLFQFNDGNQLLPYEYQTYTTSATKQIPPFDPAVMKNSFLNISENGFLNWESLNILQFTGNAPLFSLNTSFEILPINPSLNIPSWIAANQFKPTQRCAVFFTVFYTTASASGNVEIQIAVRLNGSAITSNSIFLDTPGSSGEMSWTTTAILNGTTDFLEIYGNLSGSGVGAAALTYLNILAIVF